MTALQAMRREMNKAQRRAYQLTRPFGYSRDVIKYKQALWEVEYYRKGILDWDKLYGEPRDK